MNDVMLGKFLSLVLRHKPEEIGLTLNAAGWADIDELLRLAAVSPDSTSAIAVGPASWQAAGSRGECARHGD